MPATSSRIRARATSGTLLAVGCALAVGLSACSSSGSKSATSTSTTRSTTSSTSTSTSTTAASTAAAATGDVQVAQTKLGKVLVDQTGQTLYLLTKDSPTTSTCTGVSAQAWPPLTVTGTPTAGTGVTGTVTTIRRADGTTQVVVNGHPLYTFAGDSKPGDASGQNVEKIWFMVTPAGEPVAASAG